MNYSTHRLSLDLHDTSSCHMIYCKKGDTARQIAIDLNESGVPYIISEDCYAMFVATKPDNNGLSDFCKIENNVIYYQFTEQTATVVGQMDCEIVILNSEKVITSARFCITVEEALHSFNLPNVAMVDLEVIQGKQPFVTVEYERLVVGEDANFNALVGDTICLSLPNTNGCLLKVNGEILQMPFNVSPFTYKHTIVSDNKVLIKHGTDGQSSTVSIEDAPVYENCTDKNGNVLKPVFVNNRYWELENGNLKMPKGYENSFLLFGNPRVNKIEATFVVRDTGLWADGNRRCGLVFALTDYNEDLNFRYDDTDVSYYWAFINDWNCVEVVKMARYEKWKWLSTQTADLYYHFGIDVTKGVTLAVEWDNSGHIKVYANGILVQEVTDTTNPLRGNNYGLLVNNHGNFNPAYGPYDSPVTSFVAG